ARASELPQPGIKLSANDAKVGGTLTVTATVSGGNAPTGTLTINGYHSHCGGGTPVTKAPAGHRHGTPNAALHPHHPGHLNWSASYSGDQGNMASSASCGPARSEISSATPTLDENPTDAGLGEEVSNTITLAGGANETGTLTVIAATDSDCESRVFTKD